MVNPQFVETEHVQLYSTCRPDVPTEIARMSVDFLKEKFDGDLELAVDVGCGSGQSSGILAPFFRNVYALDVSATQIQEAIRNRPRPNVHYRVQDAESLPFESSSVQLVTACGSLHWFDLEVFFREARRILVPGGVLVACTYHLLRPFLDCPRMGEDVGRLYEQIMEELHPYWPKEVHSSLEKYGNVDFPFEECRRVPDIRQFLTGKFSDLVGYVESLSAFQTMKKRDSSKAESFINSIRKRLHELLEIPGEEEGRKIKLYRDFYCVMCRKE